MPKPYNTRTFAHLKTQQIILARRLRALRAASETQDGFGTKLSTTQKLFTSDEKYARDNDFDMPDDADLDADDV